MCVLNSTPSSVNSTSPIDFAASTFSVYQILENRAGAPLAVVVNSIMAGSKSPQEWKMKHIGKMLVGELSCRQSENIITLHWGGSGHFW